MNIIANDNHKPLVSILVPAYNEEAIIEDSLKEFFQYMKRLENDFRWELIVINDGSTDGTGKKAEEIVSNLPNATVLHHMYNFRLGQALRYAFYQSRGDYVVVLDIDLSYSLENIQKMLAKMRETNAKIVIASPYKKGGKVTDVPLLRKLLSIWANRFLCFLSTRDPFSDKLTNITGMVRAYDGEFIRRLNLKAMDVDINPEIIYKAKILRARIVEIPAHLNWQLPGVGNKSKSSRQSNMRILRSIIQSFLSGFIMRPFMFFMLPGSLICFLSLYPITWTIIHTINFYNEINSLNISFDFRLSEAIGMAFRQAPHAFIVGGIALLIGIQFISLGFLAFQKKRYFEELFHLSSTISRDIRHKKLIE